jgi:hypothetical protein
MNPRDDQTGKDIEMSIQKQPHHGGSTFLKPVACPKRTHRSRMWKWAFPFVGFASLIWFLIRVVPRPSRASYPCMKAAAPLAGGFLAYLVGLIATAVSFKKAGNLFRKSQYALASVLVLAGSLAGLFTVLHTQTESRAFSVSSDSLFVPTDPPNSPMGTARGIFPGRVVWAWDSTATSWKGNSGNWWSDASTNQEAVDSMLCRSLRELSGKSSDAEAWDALFKYFNEKHGKGSIGYQPGEKIVVKINLNQSYSPGNPGNASFTSPQVVLSLLRQLVNKAGVQAGDITFYDLIRFAPDPIYTKCKGEFPDVHFMGWTGSNGREKYVRDTADYIHWSYDLTQQINHVENTYMATVVNEAAYMINLASFKAHTQAGVTFCAKNHFGSLSVDDADHNPYLYAPHAAGVHRFMCVHYFKEGGPEYTYAGRLMGTYNPLVDLMGYKNLGGKTFLFMMDALYGVQSERVGVSLNSKWLSAPFNNDWTSSLFLSQDNVAIESVGLDFFRTEQSINPNITLVYGAVDNYLHEASQADNPPSGTFYSPDGDGVRLQSLGVHEHWNNAAEKEYTRNLGSGNGIELFSVQGSTSSVAQEPSTPSTFALHQNYPNPFNPSTTIAFRLSRPGRVRLVVFDARGRRIRTLVDSNQPAGEHKAVWYGVTDQGTESPSGVYVARLEIWSTGGQIVKNLKMVLQK